VRAESLLRTLNPSLVMRRQSCRSRNVRVVVLFTVLPSALSVISQQSLRSSDVSAGRLHTVSTPTSVTTQVERGLLNCTDVTAGKPWRNSARPSGVHSAHLPVAPPAPSASSPPTALPTHTAALTVGMPPPLRPTPPSERALGVTAAIVMGGGSIGVYPCSSLTLPRQTRSTEVLQCARRPLGLRCTVGSSMRLLHR
jgi:hypothetical protein